MWINLVPSIEPADSGGADIPARDANYAPVGCTVFAEYLWLGGIGTQLKSRTKVLELQPSADGSLPSAEACPTVLESSVDGDVLLQPRRVFADPFRKGAHILVLCDTFQPPQELSLDTDPEQLTPCAYNHRVPCQNLLDAVAEDAPMFGVEQEYAVHVGKASGLPSQWMSACEPAAITGSDERVHGAGMLSWGKTSEDWVEQQVTPAAVIRELSDRHLQYCLAAGLKVTGARQKPAAPQLQHPYPRPPQTALSNCTSAWGCEQKLTHTSPPHRAAFNSAWSYKIGPCSGVDLGDQLWVSRYMLMRLAERCNVPITFDSPAPIGSKYATTTASSLGFNLSCPVKYSTAASRTPGSSGLAALQHLVGCLEATHDQHALVYSRAACGDSMTAALSPFTSSLGGTMASVTIPTTAVLNANGYLVDRRPAACMDPYIVTMFLVAATLQRGAVEGGGTLAPAASAVVVGAGSAVSANVGVPITSGAACFSTAAPGSPGGRSQVLSVISQSASSSCSSHSPGHTWGSHDGAQSASAGVSGLAAAAASDGGLLEWGLPALLTGDGGGMTALSTGQLADNDEEDDALLSDVDDAGLMMSEDEVMEEDEGRNGGWEPQQLSAPGAELHMPAEAGTYCKYKLTADGGGGAAISSCAVADGARRIPDQSPAATWRANLAIFGASLRSGNSLDDSDSNDDEPDSDELLLEELEKMDSASDSASEGPAAGAMNMVDDEHCLFGGHQGGRHRGATLYQLACLAAVQQVSSQTCGGNSFGDGGHSGGKCVTVLADGSGGESAFHGWGKALQLPRSGGGCHALGGSSSGSSPDQGVQRLLESMLSCAPRSW